MTFQQIYHNLTFSAPILQSASWIKTDSLPRITQDEDSEFTEIHDPTSVIIGATVTLPCYMTEKKISYTTYIQASLDAEKCPSSCLSANPEYVKYDEQYYPFRVKLCEISNNGSASKRWIEIWNNNIRHMVYDTTSLHGDYYLKNVICGTCISPDSKLFVYLADSEPINQQNTLQNTLRSHDDIDVDKIKKTYAHKQDWGEQYGKTRKHPAMILVDIQNMTVKKIQLENDSLHPCQMQFYPSNSSSEPWKLLFIAYPTLPRRSGSCYNTQNELYICDLKGSNLQHIPINANDGPIVLKCFRDPRPIIIDPNDHNRRDIILVGAEAGGPHRPVDYLIHLYSNGRSPFSATILVSGRESTDKSFPGLCLSSNLLPKPFVLKRENQKSTALLLFDTYWHFRTTIIAYDLSKPKNMINLTPNPETTSWKLLDHYENGNTCHLLAMVKSFQFPSKLAIGHIDLSNIKCPDWKYISLSKTIDSSMKPGKNIFEWFLNQTKVETFFVPTEFEDEPIHVSLIHQTAPFTESKNIDKKLPCIVIPHGGPHVSFIYDWNTLIQGLVVMGYVVILINYTGSNGYGDEVVKKLIGRIGELDVEQIHNAAQYTIKKYDSIIDNQRVFVMGGSHGGFLAAWMSVRYGKLFYRAIVMRNPVVDLLLNYGGTDLPDWSFFEAGMEWDYRNPTFPPSIDQIETMLRMSPSTRLSEASCDFLFVPPTLIILGEQDRRAFTANGHRWAEKLKSKGIHCELYVMPNTGHIIEGVNNERDTFYLIAQFLQAQS